MSALGGLLLMAGSLILMTVPLWVRHLLVWWQLRSARRWVRHLPVVEPVRPSDHTTREA